MAELDSGEWAASLRRARRALRAGADARRLGRERDGRRQRPAAAGARWRRRRPGPGSPRCCRPRRVRSSRRRPPSSRAAGARRGQQPTLPLDGVLVVDATKFLAGPFGGLVLQDLGARVVKVDPPGGEDFRTVAGGVVLRAEPRQGPGLHRPQGRGRARRVHRAGAPSRRAGREHEPPGGRRAAARPRRPARRQPGPRALSHRRVGRGTARRHARLRPAAPGPQRPDGRPGRGRAPR